MQPAESRCTEKCALNLWPTICSAFKEKHHLEQITEMCLHLYPSEVALTLEEEIAIIRDILNSTLTIRISNHIPFSYWREIFNQWPEGEIITVDKLCFDHKLAFSDMDTLTHFFQTFRIFGHKCGQNIKEWCIHGIYANERYTVSSATESLSQMLVQGVIPDNLNGC